MTQLEQDVKKEVDDFAKVSTLSEEQHRSLCDHLLRKRKAIAIAEKHGVDAGDVEHVLFNLTLSPQERLARSFQRAGLSRYSTTHRP